MKKILIAALFIIAAVGAFADGMGTGGVDSDLVGRWRWIGVSLGLETVETGDESSSYLLTFNDDGSFEVLADCRTGSGMYTADGKVLTMSLNSMSAMECDANSLVDEFEKLLKDAGSFSYSISSGNRLDLEFAGGTGAAEFLKTNDAM